MPGREKPIAGSVSSLAGGRRYPASGLLPWTRRRRAAALAATEARAADDRREIERRRSDLQADLAYLLDSSLEPQEVVEHLLDLVFGWFSGGCAVLLPSADGLRRAAFRAPDGAVSTWNLLRAAFPDLPYEADSPLALAYRTGDLQILSGDQAAAPDRSSLCVAVPLTAHGKALGVLCLLEGETPLQAEDVSLAVTIGARAGGALDIATRFRRARDMAVALQGPAFPPGLEAPGLSLDTDQRIASASALAGGTWCDAIELEDGCLFFSLGSAIGGGAEAAALMAQVRGAMRAYAVDYPSPAAVLSGLDRLFEALRERRSVTAVAGVADPATGELWLANAGHPSPLLVPVVGPATPIEAGRSAPLGAGSAGSERTEHRLVLGRGESLLCSSGAGDLDHLVTLVDSVAPSGRGHGTPWVCDLADLLAGGEQAIEGDDDLALLAVRYTGDRHRTTMHPAGADRALGMAPPGAVPRIQLPPAVASAPTARRWVAAHLADLPDELVDTAILLTSELVANAGLHAGTDVIVSIHRGEERVRIDVADCSPNEPVRKGYGTDAVTGRGLTLFDRLAAAWGTRPMIPSGKIVWFELPVDIPGVAGETGALPFDLDAWPEPAGLAALPIEPPSDEPAVEIRLLGVPVAALNRASEQYDALYREFRLVVEQGPSNPGGAPERLIALIDELGTRFAGFTAGFDEVWRAALERGDPDIDLVLRLPPAVGPACEHYDQLLDQADHFCRVAELMTLPATPEAVALRKWFLLEFSRQAAGGAAVRWSESSWARTLGRGTTRPRPFAPTRRPGPHNR